MDDAAAPMSNDEPQSIGMSRRELLGSLAFLVIVFLFIEGPLWKDPWNMSRMDSAIGWSYAPIPIYVAVFLAVKRKLEVRGWLLDTMALTFAKFSITAILALSFWGRQARPPEEHIVLAPAMTTKTRPAPTPIATEMTGAVEAKVTDEKGAPIAGAFVYVASGLEKLVFAPPSSPLELTDAGAGFRPSLSVAMVGQRIEARSLDGHLHGLVARSEGNAAFHVPVLKSGAPSPATIDDPGTFLVTCSIHPGAAIEPPARIIVLANPFFATTDAEGKVVLRGVPAGPITVTAATEGANKTAPVQVNRQETATIELAL